ncbi:hypothetical protein P170DRAFT_438678 [Aspergillus steynii IBT 23096]|uniref:Eisosome protein 1 n=1 Tax=Aspergillus steynii IBT 23096 TaxID=1392250 RepID=A0A2I2G279_9EURO|nr:uncharacterized protein P170DRAFT_438678 [Aspergillus steynii IBT 23096]PLB46967.1 hypothetical protein P170DRAFT_438678 [Aspergillus steynii IBT 23096]
MATIEQPPAQRAAIPRSRSARLADQAATAALFVTHPERRLSVREPRAPGTDLSTLKATGSRPGFSHASAVAALAHAKSKQPESGRSSTAAIYVPDYPPETPSQEGYKAAISAIRDHRSIASPAPADSKHDTFTADARREITSREKAIRAASGAFYNSRKRADSAPLEDPYAMSGARDPLDELDSSAEASRIQHVANTNARLYTASPPVAIEVEEQNKKNVMRAAAISMAREMYGIAENAEDQTGAAIPAAQRGHARARSQQVVNKATVGALQRAMSLQEVAQKRAAEKLASMQDETAVYREYYGIEPQASRSSLPARRRRASVDSDESSFDAERSREIRYQMTNLRSKLDAVDEQRQRDRALLMEAARKNVDAAIQDMEKRAYADTGRAPPSVRKEWEDAALARAEKDMQEIDAQLIQPDRVNLGAHKFVDMSDVEALARSRLQPTFDEIHERAEAQRARELEQRLDEEERLRHDAVERQREADTRAEEKRQRAVLKQQSRGKEERSWPWRKKAKRDGGNAPETPLVKDRVAAEENNEPAGEGLVGTVTQDTVQTDTVTGNDQAVASGAAAEPSPATSPILKSESKLKTWIGKLGGRRSSTTAAAAAPREAGVSPEPTSGVPDEERPVSGDDSRAAPLRSNPVSAHDIAETQRGSADPDRTDEEQEFVRSSENSGDRRSRLKSRFSRIVSRGSQEMKTDGVETPDQETQGESVPVEHTAADELHGQSPEKDGLRESAVEQGLPIPPAIGKRLSNGTGRESRFSEDL